MQAQSAVAITFQDLKPLLYDSSRSVRKAMVEFIQQVAGIKTLKWWESFPPADLVSIMGSDNKDVAEIIHNMLFTQYVEGDDLNLQVWLLHCLHSHSIFNDQEPYDDFSAAFNVFLEYTLSRY